MVRIRLKNSYVNIDKTNLVLITIMLIAVIFFVNRCSKRVEIDETKENLLYTIGKVNSFRSGFKTSNNLYYVYTDDGSNVIKGRHSLTSDSLVNREKWYFEDNYFGKYFLVEFSTEYSWYTNLFLDKPVPDSLVQCCKNKVWKTPPFTIPKKVKEQPKIKVKSNLKTLSSEY